MAGFSFPPPPPPPPRSTAPEGSAANSLLQRGGLNNSRSERGGRGNHGGRGRGQNNNFRDRSQQRGGHGFQRSRDQNTDGDHRQHNAGGRGQQQQYNYNQASQSQHVQSRYPPAASTVHSPTQVPVNSYVNPSFSPMVLPNQMQVAAPTQPQIDPMAFMQAFSTFMVSQSGMQNLATQASPMPQNQYLPPPPPPQNFSNNQSPPSMAGAKRKRGSKEGYQEHHIPQHQDDIARKPKPTKVKTYVPPTVPSFGFALPTAPKASPAQPTVLPKSKKEKKKPIGNLLGLTPQIDYSDSDQESVDEEATFGSGIAGLTFEYNGEVAALNSPAEIAAWIRERKKLYPTKARARQKLEEERIRLANEQAILQRVKNDADGKTGIATKTEEKKGRKHDQKPWISVDDKQKQVEHDKQLKKIEKLRKKLQKSEEMLARSEGQNGVHAETESISDVKHVPAPAFMNQPKNGLGLNYESDTDAAIQATDDSESSESADSVSSSDSDSGSDSSEDSGGSDSAPDEETSKNHQSVRLLPPKENRVRKTEQTVCSYFKRNGKCTNRRCKFSHPPGAAAKEPKKRMSLYERMVEQEEKAADMLALQAIKYLGSTGFLS